MADDHSGIEDRLGYRFRDPTLLADALTHGSVGASVGSNQRLGFLGDAVLELAVSDGLYGRDRQASAGEMTEARIGLVNNAHLADVARSLGVGTCLRLGKGVSQSGGADRTGILANALEAIIGAVYLDGGLEEAAALVDRHVAGGFAAVGDDLLHGRSSKSVLQEWLQARGCPTPEYRLVSETGPSHERTYRVEANCGPRTGSGEGSTKKLAEERAAAAALRQLVESNRETVDQPSAEAEPGPVPRVAALVAGIGLAVLGAMPLAGAGVSPEASLSAADKLQRLAEGDFESGATVELSEDEVNSYIQFHVAAVVPEGVDDVSVTFREGGAVLRARVDLDKAGTSNESISPLMRLLLQGTRAIVADIDFAATGGSASGKLTSVTVDGAELSGPLLEWFVEALAPAELRPFVMGEEFQLESGVSEIRLGPGRAVVVAE